MNIFCGTDIIEIGRIKKAIDKRNSFINKIYTQNEIDYCESKGKSKYQHYAARFAAKEAVFKSISSLLNNKYDIDWKNIEIINDVTGKPSVNFINLNLNLKCDISLSHCKQYATAVAIISKL